MRRQQNKKKKWHQIWISLSQIRCLSPTLDRTPGVFPWRVTQCEPHLSGAVYCSHSKEFSWWKRWSGFIPWSWFTTQPFFFTVLPFICNLLEERSWHTHVNNSNELYQLFNIKHHPQSSSTGWQPGRSVDGNNCEPEWEGTSKGDSCLNLCWVLHYTQAVMKGAPVPLNWLQSAVRRLGITEMKQWCNTELFHAWRSPLNPAQALDYTQSSHALCGFKHNYI